jgi:eukaryotic-like serine/threonine-protein kinase
MKHAAARASRETPTGLGWPRRVTRPSHALATFERADTEACAIATPTPAESDEGGERMSGVQLVSRLGQYRLLKLIGSGAMGHVYEAEHVLLGRRVALKTLRREFAGNRSFEERMFAEARVGDVVDDEHIVKVFDLAHDPNGLTWFAMELLEGESLATLCDRREVPLARALEIARQLCDALIPVHDAGIVHRDIKPDNVFVVNRDGCDLVKLLDFGIARLPTPADTDDVPNRPEVVIGTPPYMAPEQVYGGEVDARSDLYAVGALLYELITGRLLFDRSNMTELLGTIVLAQPPLPSEHATLPEGVCAHIDRVVKRCLAKDRTERFASARELAAELAVIALHLEFGVSATSERDDVADTVTELAEVPAIVLAAASALQTDPVVDDELSPGSDAIIAAPPRAPRPRRAVAWVALTAAAATWFAPASALPYMRPAVASVGSWVEAVMAGAPWSKLAAPAVPESISANDP